MKSKPMGWCQIWSRILYLQCTTGL